MNAITTSPGTTGRIVGRVTEFTTTGPLAGLRLPPGVYEAYVQAGRWSQESQGRWVPLHAGTLVLHGTSGRTTQGGTPFVALRRCDEPGICLVSHVLPRGDWEMRLRVESGMHGIGPLGVEWGYSGGHAVAPLSVAVTDAESPEAAAPLVHRWWVGRFGGGRSPGPRVLQHVAGSVRQPRVAPAAGTARRSTFDRV